MLIGLLILTFLNFRNLLFWSAVITALLEKCGLFNIYESLQNTKLVTKIENSLSCLGFFLYLPKEHVDDKDLFDTTQKESFKE